MDKEVPRITPQKREFDLTNRAVDEIRKWMDHYIRPKSQSNVNPRPLDSAQKPHIISVSDQQKRTTK
jgi:hypothetical protein